MAGPTNPSEELSSVRNTRSKGRKGTLKRSRALSEQDRVLPESQEDDVEQEQEHSEPKRSKAAPATQNSTLSTAVTQPSQAPANTPATPSQQSQTKTPTPLVAKSVVRITAQDAALGSTTQTRDHGAAGGSKPEARRPAAVPRKAVAAPVFKLSDLLGGIRAEGEADKAKLSASTAAEEQKKREYEQKYAAQRLDLQKRADQEQKMRSKEAPKPKQQSERRVHLYDHTMVCDLLHLLEQEFDIAQAKVNGDSYRPRPANITKDRSLDTIHWEIRALRKQKAMLESVPTRVSDAEFLKLPGDLVTIKVAPSFPFSTPVRIGPKYSIAGLLPKVKQVVREKFDFDTEKGLAACEYWLDVQIGDLKKNSLAHYNPTANNSAKESRMLQDVKEFRKYVIKRKEGLSLPLPGQFGAASGRARAIPAATPDHTSTKSSAKGNSSGGDSDIRSSSDSQAGLGQASEPTTPNRASCSQGKDGINVLDSTEDKIAGDSEVHAQDPSSVQSPSYSPANTPYGGTSPSSPPFTPGSIGGYGYSPRSPPSPLSPKA